MPDGRSVRASLPCGVRDLFGDEAARLSKVIAAWRSLFEGWAYAEIITPTYENYDVLMIGSGLSFEKEAFRVLDREGNILALRPDITPQVARIVGTKLFDLPLPLRFYYLANVFRYREPQAGQQREFFQAGIELIGAAGPEADAEVLAIAIEALREVGLRGFQLNVGQMGFYRSVVAEAGLSSAEGSRLRWAINRKDEAALHQVLAEAEINKRHALALAELPRLCGGPEVLERAAALAPNAGAHQAIDNLSQIYALLEAYDLADRVTIDLGEVRGMEYYTGMKFEVFTPGVGFAICSGGRYDELVARYGPPMPAVGFAIGVERVLLALEQPGQPGAGAGPALLVAGEAAVASGGALRRLRRQGVTVETDIMGRDEAGLLAYARQRGIGRVVTGGDVEGVVLVADGTRRRLSWQELVEEMLPR